MKKIIISLVFSLGLVLFVTGCGPKTIDNGLKIDANQKTIFIGGTSYFTSVFRKEFEANGWYVTTQSGHQVIAGRGAGKYNYKTRYTLAYSTYVRQSIPPVRNFEITIIDNYDGKDVVTFSEDQRGFWAAMTEKEIAEMVMDWVNSNLDKSKVNTKAQLQQKNMNTINDFEKEATLKDNKFYSKSDDKPLNGDYERFVTVKDNEQRIVYTFKEGSNVDRKYFDKFNNLRAQGIFEDGLPKQLKVFYPSGLLSSISQIKKELLPTNRMIKDGVETRFYENGSKEMELTWKDSEIQSGIIYGEDGTKEVMTEAHYYNFGLK